MIGRAIRRILAGWRTDAPAAPRDPGMPEGSELWDLCPVHGCDDEICRDDWADCPIGRESRFHDSNQFGR